MVPSPHPHRPSAYVVKRPSIRAHWLLVAAVAFIVVVGNRPLWLELLGTGPGAEGTLVAIHFLLVLAALFTLLLAPAVHRHFLKPVLVALLLVVALVNWFETQFGIIIDRHIVESALETDRIEAGELITPALLLHLAVSWLIPATVIAWVRIDTGGRGYVVRTAAIGIFAAGMLGLTLLSGYKELALVLREHKELKMMINPTYPLYAAWQVIGARADAAPPVRASLGTARVDRAPGSPPRIMVLVVGETARADHFSLNGYPRPTNPRLGRRSLINFGAVAACGTSTAVSVPCLFSPLGREQFDADREPDSENVLHLLARAGVSVLWRDNNTGCKGVCDDFEFDSLRHSLDPGLCSDRRCIDEILLGGLRQRIDSADGDLLIVLHQAGSHGPSYYRRYPDDFGRFTPACSTDSPQRCSRAELVNAYDNTLVYTDYFLDRLIGLLEHDASGRRLAMLYVSDHGESLGEMGLYLHGMPYALAPQAQTMVPMLLWLPERERRRHPDLVRCLDALAEAPLSHDNLFHTLLGYFQIATPSLDPTLDLFGRCRVETHTAGN